MTAQTNDYERKGVEDLLGKQLPLDSTLSLAKIVSRNLLQPNTFAGELCDSALAADHQ